MFECDAQKNDENMVKHGPNFEDAEAVFSGPCVMFEDDRYDYAGTRFITLGLLAGRTVVIAHTPRGHRIRIISMVKANRRERRIYAERLEEN